MGNLTLPLLKRITFKYMVDLQQLSLIDNIALRQWNTELVMGILQKEQKRSIHFFKSIIVVGDGLRHNGAQDKDAASPPPKCLLNTLRIIEISTENPLLLHYLYWLSSIRHQLYL